MLKSRESLEMWVKPHQKLEKCSEFPRFSLFGQDTTMTIFLYKVEFNVGNPQNLNGTIVVHLDMNYYKVEFDV